MDKGVVIVIVILIIIVLLIFFFSFKNTIPNLIKEDNKTKIKPEIPKYDLVLSAENEKNINYELVHNKTILKQGNLLPNIPENLGKYEKGNYSIKFFGDDYYLGDISCRIFSDTYCTIYPQKKPEVSLNLTETYLEIDLDQSIIYDTYLCVGYSYPILDLDSENERIEIPFNKHLLDDCYFIGDIKNKYFFNYTLEGYGNLTYYFYDYFRINNGYEKGIRDFEVSIENLINKEAIN